MKQGRDFTCAEQGRPVLAGMEDTPQAPGTEKSTETEILCSQPVPITLCCQSLFTGGQSRGVYSSSEKGQLAPAADPQLEVLETGSEKYTFEFKNAFLSSIYHHHHHHQSIKNVACLFIYFFKCALQISSMYKCTMSTKLGHKTLVLCYCQCGYPQGLGPQNTSGNYFPDRPVPKFVFSPVILQFSRNNQNFKPRALQNIGSCKQGISGRGGKDDFCSQETPD